MEDRWIERSLRGLLTTRKEDASSDYTTLGIRPIDLEKEEN